MSEKDSPKAKLWTAFIAGVFGLLGGTVAIVGESYLGTEDARRENSLQFVNIAIEILRSEPDQDASALRGWAVDVINHHHPSVPIDERTRRVLLHKSLADAFNEAMLLDMVSSYIERRRVRQLEAPLEAARIRENVEQSDEADRSVPLAQPRENPANTEN